MNIKKSQDFTILNKSDHDLLVFKPSGMASQLTSDPRNSSLISQLRMEYEPKLNPELPHRLDRITSGIIVVALTKESLRFHNKNIEEKKWQKYYLARVSPQASVNLETICGEHKAYLKRKGKINTVVRSGGQPSFLKILAVFPAPEKDGQYHVLIELLTGRFHQIRVMLAEMGLPLTDDFLYNPKKIKTGKEDFYLESIILKYIEFNTKEFNSVFYKNNPQRESIDEELLELIEGLALEKTP